MSAIQQAPGPGWQPGPQWQQQQPGYTGPGMVQDAAGRSGLRATDVSAWFGSKKVLERVSLSMEPGKVTALIGPSGCGKSTFLRILNRMHELIPSAATVRIRRARRCEHLRPDGTGHRTHGFASAWSSSGPNPFPSMTIAQNVLAGLRLSGTKVSEFRCPGEGLPRPGRTVEGDPQPAQRGRRGPLRWPAATTLHRPGAGRSAEGAPDGRAVLGARPDLHQCHRGDHRASLCHELTIVIVTHNMQQAQRVSDNCALFLVDGEGDPGHIVEAGPTYDVFNNPRDPRTSDYVHGRFG